MRFGKIRIEDKELKFTKVVKSCLVPCEDIRWAYGSRDSVVIITKMQKRYQFEMTREEVRACLAYLKECNPDMIMGCPRGGAVPLVSSFNTRDLGGFTAEDGRHILPHQLLRSEDLYHLSQKDVRLLREEYHLQMVVDFRTEEERRQKPDTRIDGVVYQEAPVLEEATLGISREKSVMEMLEGLSDNPEIYMINMYQQLILNKNSQYQYAKFFQWVLENEEGHSVLWHCSAGKDRAGVASMLLLAALGVPRGEILDDYMYTNICLKKDLEYVERLMESKGMRPPAMEKMRILLSARECYLQSAMNTILSEYGSMERYLRKAMCLTPRHIQKLRGRYLV